MLCSVSKYGTNMQTVWDSQGGPSWSTENTLMKMVTPYATGRHSNPRATGLDALRMKWRTSTNIRTDVAPDSTGDRNQDTTETQHIQSMGRSFCCYVDSRPFWEAGSSSSTQSCHVFYINQRFITEVTTDHHWSLSWAIWIQSTWNNPVSLI